ncbi:MAG: rhomboid family intramembrane serine protease [Flavipsychrobacter sp.]
MSINIIIILITVGISISAFNNIGLFNKLILWPNRMDTPREYYRLLSSGFIHADYMHLAFNMFTLFFFGDAIESIFRFHGLATFMFPILYLTGIIAAALPSFVKHRANYGYRALGASGGVSAILFSFVYFAPWEKIYLFGVIGIPSILAAVAYLIYSAYMSKKGMDNVGHDAHFYGAIYGFLFTLLFEPSHGKVFIEQIMNPYF